MMLLPGLLLILTGVRSRSHCAVDNVAIVLVYRLSVRALLVHVRARVCLCLCVCVLFEFAVQ